MQLVLYANDMLLYREIVCPEDYTVLQNDINTVNNWVKCNYLTFINVSTWSPLVEDKATVIHLTCSMTCAWRGLKV